MAEGRRGDALLHYREALRIKPDDAHVHYNLAVALEQEGASAEAIVHYREAVRLRPGHANAQNNLGVAEMRAGRFAEAIGHFRQAVAAKRDNAAAADNLAFALAQHGDPAEAERMMRAVADGRASGPLVPYHLGLALARQGRPAEALEPFDRAARLRSRWPDPLAQMAWLLATAPSVRDPSRALEMAQQACARSDKSAVAFQSLAAAQAAAGHYEDAVVSARRAAELAANDAPRLAAIRAAEVAYRAARQPPSDATPPVL